MQLFGLRKPGTACAYWEPSFWCDVFVMTFENDRDQVCAVVVEGALFVRSDPMVQPNRVACKDDHPTDEVGVVGIAEAFVPTKLEPFKLFVASSFCVFHSGRLSVSVVSGASKVL